MMDPSISQADADAAYRVEKTVSPDFFAAVIARYRTDSRKAVNGLSGHPGIVYDERSGERLDIWGTGPEPRPVFVFLHGGYWRRLSRADSAFMARMLSDQGIATVAVDYTLAPAATLEEIVRQTRAAIAWVYRHGAEHGLDPHRIVVGGSSAGGHLAAMVMLDGWQDAFGVPPDVVAAAMPFSGLFDLRPLVGGFTDAWLGLDEARARELSPAFAAGRWPRTVLAVAEHDGTGFLRQSRDFHRALTRHSTARTDLLIVPERNHYDVILDLTDPETEVSRALIDVFRAVRPIS